MSTNVKENPRTQVMEVLKQTPPTQIAELDFVKSKFIENYNFCHKEKVGELMYHRQVVHFKQLILNDENLRKADQFSLYACFVTAAVNGYSLDPADNEVYLLSMGGKAYLWRQAGAHVRRLMNSGQIVYADQPRLVYEGDVYEVENGRVVKHVEKFESENIRAGYVRFVIDSKGTDKYFTYRKSDWETWRKKSKQPNSDNWNSNGQPAPGFLRTKIVKHAATDKSWATGRSNSSAENFNVEIEDTEDVVITNVPSQQGSPVQKEQKNENPSGEQTMDDDAAFASDSAAATNGHQFTDDDF